MISQGNQSKSSADLTAEQRRCRLSLKETFLCGSDTTCGPQWIYWLSNSFSCRLTEVHSFNLTFIVFTKKGFFVFYGGRYVSMSSTSESNVVDQSIWRRRRRISWCDAPQSCSSVCASLRKLQHHSDGCHGWRRSVCLCLLNKSYSRSCWRIQKYGLIDTKT